MADFLPYNDSASPAYTLVIATICLHSDITVCAQMCLRVVVFVRVGVDLFVCVCVCARVPYVCECTQNTEQMISCTKSRTHLESRAWRWRWRWGWVYPDVNVVWPTAGRMLGRALEHFTATAMFTFISLDSFLLLSFTLFTCADEKVTEHFTD